MIQAQKSDVLFSVLIVLVLIASLVIPPTRVGAAEESIANKIADKSALERATIKGQEIAKIGHIARAEREKYDVEIVSIESIDGGVEVFVRAWKDGKQIGFGADGTVDMERFRIFNPPILVPDPKGGIIQEWTDKNGETQSRSLREDPEEALLQVIEHNLSVMKNIHGAENIISGKRGNTTSTFFPAAGANSPVDGIVAENTDASWGTIQADSGDTADATGITGAFGFETGSSFFLGMSRATLLFDTSSLGNDTIDNAVLSVYDYTSGSSGTRDTWGLSSSFNVYVSAPASNNALDGGDYDSLGTAAFSDTAIVFTNYTTNDYNNLTLNATGEATIDGDGITKLGLREATYDAPDNDPGFSTSKEVYFAIHFADETGTTQDPKLVVEHTAPNSAPTAPTSLLTEGQTNPANISDPNPEFSAVYNDADSGDLATAYRIQVATSSGFATIYWDSGTLTMATTTQGTRSPDLSYGGSSLASTTTYYWRIKFSDDEGVVGAWSTEEATFSLAEPASLLKVRKSSNESVQSSSTLQNDDHLVLGLQANKQYIVDGMVFASASSTAPDLKIAFTAPSGATLVIGYINDSERGVLSAGVASSQIAVPGASALIPVHFSGTVMTAGLAGDVVLRWAQNATSTNATTIHAGSFIRAEEI